MKRTVVFLCGAVVALAASNAGACTTLQEAMQEFEGVKNAYVAKAPTMKPEKFQIWAKHIQAFGDAMGSQDYETACKTLAAASDELGLGADNAGSSAAAAVTPPPPPPTGESANLAGTWSECPRGRCRK